MVAGFMGIEIKPGQIWQKVNGKEYGDINRFCVIAVTVTNRGIPCVELANCATMARVFAIGSDQVNSFSLDCELTKDKPNPALFGGYKFEKGI